MFEKEAEEYYENVTVGTFQECTENFADAVLTAYKDGAEFGYNKANEWHYVRDELPKELHDVLCFVIHNEHRFVLQGYLRDGRWVLSPLGTYLNNDDVIAWKEIVLPELKEDEIESEMFPEIILPEGSSEFIDKVIADAEKRVKEI